MRTKISKLRPVGNCKKHKTKECNAIHQWGPRFSLTEGRFYEDIWGRISNPSFRGGKREGEDNYVLL